MIKSILVENCATYKDKDNIIDGCKKINFIYGANGSGKTTIGKFLADQENELYKNCKIEWENPSRAEILVYNRDFKRKHFKGDIEGVFTLGQATIEDVEKLEKLKEDRNNKNDEIQKRENTLKTKKEESITINEKYKQKFWDEIFKKNEDEFSYAFVGYKNSKERFKENILERNKDYRKIKDKIFFTKEELNTECKELFKYKNEKIDLINLSFVQDIEDIKKIENNPVFEKIIVGNLDLSIAKLIKELDNADWVNKGREYIIDEEDVGICPFCQQRTITKQIKEQIQDFFDKEYEDDILNLKENIEKYNQVTKRFLATLRDINLIMENIELKNIKLTEFHDNLSDLEIVFLQNNKCMESKLNEVSRIVNLNKSENIVNHLLNLINDTNSLILEHNKKAEKFEERKETLKTNIWNYLLFENQSLINEFLQVNDRLERAIRGIQSGINKIKKQLIELEEKIYQDEKNITSVQPTVDEINRSLKSYGFTNFKIANSPIKENSYQIQRLDGTMATDTLSEGEETFISFLYFFQYAKGASKIEKISKRKILVLDDPICSLDSTILYIVSSMVKSLIRDVKDGKSEVEQMFILTHNVFFHKEASYFDGRTTTMNDINYWIISKDNNVSTIRSYGENNPIKTSYQLLWSELKNNENASCITIQNTMRRIIENYFGIMGKHIDENIISEFESLEEKMICRSLISWINDGSHTIADDLYIDSYSDSKVRYKKVFKQIFKKMGHEAHYNMMMSI